MALEHAMLLRKNDVSRLCLGRTPSNGVSPAAAQRLGPLIERCSSLVAVDLYLAHVSIESIRILLKHISKSKSVVSLNVVGGLSILQAKILGNALSQFVAVRRFPTDSGFSVVLEPIQFDDLLASLVMLGLERSTAITAFAVRPLNKAVSRTSVAKIRLRLSSILQRNRSRYSVPLSPTDSRFQQPSHKQNQDHAHAHLPTPPGIFHQAFVREGSVHTPDPVRFAVPQPFATPTATPTTSAPGSKESILHQPQPPDQPRQCCAQITNLYCRNHVTNHGGLPCAAAVVMDQFFHKIPAPPVGGSTPTIRHPSPPRLDTSDLIAAFADEADRTRQFVLDFACQEREKFFTVTEALCNNVSASMNSLVQKYAELANHKSTAAPFEPLVPAVNNCRRPVQHFARIISQG